MPHPGIALDYWKHQIIELYHQQYSADDIQGILHEQYNIKTSARTVRRRLKEWGCSKLHPIPDTPQLRARISVLFFEYCASDKEIIHILEKEGHQLSLYGLSVLRARLGLTRRVSRFNREEADERLSNIVQEELDKGFIEGYGRNYLYSHFRSQMHCISRSG